MKETIKHRITKLREKMQEHGIDAYLILSDDFHASEYVDAFFKCRAYMSGFTGSAGTMVVTKDEAALWTDGRYFLQAGAQLAGTGIKLMKQGEPGVPTVGVYLKEKLPEKGCLGFDGRTVNAAFTEGLKMIMTDLTFVTGYDLVGELWEDRPAFPAGKIWELPSTLTGETREERFARVREAMKNKKADVFLLASLDDIAWLYELRGEDIACNPVFMSYTLVYQDKAVLYAAQSSMSEELVRKLKNENIEVKPYLAVYEDLKDLDNKTLMVSPSTTNVALLDAIGNSGAVIAAENPTTTFKAVKTETEMENERKAHIQDGVAVTKLLYWLAGLEAKGCITEETELSVAEKLLELRKEREGFLDLSFESIVATGEHGAIVHYSPTEASNIKLVNDSFLLMDTGGQYLQGTTDITRTVAIGELSEEMKAHYTAVLRGNLRLAATKFKEGTTGVNLDVLARIPLWEMGLDYNHGTGHGVGYLLNVHEGPHGIRLKERSGGIGTPIIPGMLTSDEPGLYLEGKYGIRLENLMLCTNDKKTEYGEFYQFETITVVPFDKKSIMPEMMTQEEINLLNAYHEKVYEKLSPYMTEKEKNWLAYVTSPL